MLTTEVKDDQVYVYWNGVLIYKRWGTKEKRQPSFLFPPHGIPIPIVPTCTPIPYEVAKGRSER